MANIELNKDFVAAVAAGKKIFRREDFDQLGISKEMKKAAGIVDCPRWDGWVQGTGDGVKLNVNGTCVTVYGTSNMTEAEHRWYYDHKGSGNGTPRSSSSSAPDTTARDNAIALMKTSTDWSQEQLGMFLTMAHASEMAQSLFKTRQDWTTDQVIMLMTM